MENETTSDFITKFFPDRWKLLAETQSKYTTIDEVLNQPQTDGDTELEGQTGLGLRMPKDPETWYSKHTDWRQYQLPLSQGYFPRLPKTLKCRLILRRGVSLWTFPCEC